MFYSNLKLLLQALFNLLTSLFLDLLFFFQLLQLWCIILLFLYILGCCLLAVVFCKNFSDGFLDLRTLVHNLLRKLMVEIFNRLLVFFDRTFCLCYLKIYLRLYFVLGLDQIIVWISQCLQLLLQLNKIAAVLINYFRFTLFEKFAPLLGRCFDKIFGF